MRHVSVLSALGLGFVCLAGPCRADDASIGVYAHDVNLSGKRVYEGGEELIAAWGGPRIGFLAAAGGPSPYVTGGLNLNGKTNFAAAGLRWKLRMTDRFYFRPGVGLAYNDAPTTHQESGRIWSGSHVTFEPEASLGWLVNRRVALEASWVHLSQAKVFSDRNPAINELGLRAVYRFNIGPTGS
jgi:lipid A 3-O-deacylase